MYCRTKGQLNAGLGAINPEGSFSLYGRWHSQLSGPDRPAGLRHFYPDSIWAEFQPEREAPRL